MSKHLTKKENNYIKYKSDFEKGTLSRDALNRIPYDKKMEYLRREITKKYRLDANKLSSTFCCHCGETALYKDNGYISDEELIEHTGLRHV